MKSIKLKVFFLAAGFFAFSATFAQDTTGKPKPDTSKSPKPDTTQTPKIGTTSMKPTQNSLVNSNVNWYLAKNEKVEAKIEATEDEKLFNTYFVRISS